MNTSDIDITIVAFDNGPVASVAGPAETITLSAQLLGKPLPNVSIVSSTDRKVHGIGGVIIEPNKNKSDIKKTDILIIGSIGVPTQWLKRDNSDVLNWINEVAKTAKTIIAICSGAFVLAKSGVLNHHKVTTHWYYSDIFRENFPNIQLISNQKIIESGNIYTTSGVLEYANVTLCLIERMYGKRAKEICSSFCNGELQIEKVSGLLNFTQFRQHSDSLIHKLQDSLHQDPPKKWSLNELAQSVFLSERHMNRRFYEATGCTPIQYLQKIRLTIAKEKLEKTRLPISEIALNVGYEDIRYFRELFKKHTHVTPNEYRQKYRYR